MKKVFRMTRQDHQTGDFGAAAHVRPASAASPFLVVCEHASARMPVFLRSLGLSDELLRSHIAWDPGALGVAEALADLLAAPLVSGGVSRLVYDCNRPPEATDAIPSRSEIHDIPGNRDLDATQRTARIENVYEPFCRALAAEIAANPQLRVLVTVHSFTPVYRGDRREVEIGILHGDDPRFARAMLAASPRTNSHVTRLNEPYGPGDGVDHTLNRHGVANGLLNVMIEIRNDLIDTPKRQAAMADLFDDWIVATLNSLETRAAS